MSELGALVK